MQFHSLMLIPLLLFICYLNVGFSVGSECEIPMIGFMGPLMGEKGYLDSLNYSLAEINKKTNGGPFVYDRNDPSKLVQCPLTLEIYNYINEEHLTALQTNLSGSPGVFYMASYSPFVDIEVFSKSRDLVFNIAGDYAKGIDNFVSLLSYDYIANNLFPYFTINGVQKAILVGTESDQTQYNTRLAAGFAIEYGVEVSGLYFTNDPAEYVEIPLTDETKNNFTETVKNLRDFSWNDTGIIYFGSRAEGQRFFVSQLQRFGISPKMVIMFPLWFGWDNEYLSVSNYVWGLTGPFVPDSDEPDKHPLPHYPSNDYIFHNLTNIALGFEAHHGRKPLDSLIVPLGVYAGYLLYHGINLTHSLDPSVVAKAIKTKDWDTPVGRWRWDVQGRQLIDYILQQYYYGERRIVGPPLAATHGSVFPFPRWDEREFQEHWGSPEEIGIAVISAILLFTSLCWFIFVFLYWKDPIVKASSPVFLVVVLVGSLLLYLSVFTFMPHWVSDFTCNLKIWMLSLGFTIMFGALFAKSWRVERLFYNKVIDIIRITDTDVWKIVGVIVAIDLVLLTITSSVANTRKEYVELDPYERAKNFLACTTPGLRYWLPLALLVGYKIILSCYGLWLSYRLRRVHYRVYNESSVIAFAMYNTSFFAVLTAVMLLVEMSLTARFVAVSMLILGGTAITIFTLFFQKSYFILFGISASSTSKTLPTSRQTNGGKSTSRSFGENNKDMKKKVEERDEIIVTLRKEMKILRGELQRCQEMLKKYNSDSTSNDESSSSRESERMETLEIE